MLDIQVDDTSLMARLTALPSAAHIRLAQAVNAQALQLEALVKQKLSGQVLNVRTGNLRRSIFSTVIDQPTLVQGKVQSSGDVKYAGIHEFGGQTAPHVITPKNAAALAFTIDGRQVFAKIVRHPGSKMPERSFLRSSLADRATDIRASLTSAIEGAVREAVGT